MFSQPRNSGCGREYAIEPAFVNLKAFEPDGPLDAMRSLACAANHVHRVLVREPESENLLTFG
jgi:hypothetical protein